MVYKAVQLGSKVAPVLLSAGFNRVQVINLNNNNRINKEAHVAQ